MSFLKRPESAFSLDPIRKGGRLEDGKHLAFIRTLPCLVSGAEGRTDAAHIRMASPEHRKGKTPMGRKPDDSWTVPLAHAQHMDQHSMGEELWWLAQGFDPCAVAIALYAASGDEDACRGIITSAREEAAKRRSLDVPEPPPWARRRR